MTWDAKALIGSLYRTPATEAVSGRQLVRGCPTIDYQGRTQAMANHKQWTRAEDYGQVISPGVIHAKSRGKLVQVTSRYWDSKRALDTLFSIGRH